MRSLRMVVLATFLSLAAGWVLGERGIGIPRLPGDVDPMSPPVATGVGYTAWDERVAPEYYRIVGPSSIELAPEPGTATYLPLDWLGRARGAVANVTYRMMEAGRARERGDLSGLEPSGWGHNGEADIALPGGKVYHGYFWNRSHLVAKSLGGTDGLENLVCGTRMQNVGSNSGGTQGGMGYCEGLARSWLEAHAGGSIVYAATPVYEGAEPVCRSVVVDMRSSDGSLDLRVEVYNAAKGYVIDYATGSFRIAGE